MLADFLRGVKIGAICLVGADALLLLILFGTAMCAGPVQEWMLEELDEQSAEWPSRAIPATDAVRHGEFPSPLISGGRSCLRNIHSYRL